MPQFTDDEEDVELYDRPAWGLPGRQKLRRTQPLNCLRSRRAAFQTRSSSPIA